MHLFILQSLLGLAFLASTTSTMKSEVPKTYLGGESTSDGSDGLGFLEDINFASFFEEAGLDGSGSAPKVVKYHSSSYDTAPSNNHFTVIKSHDDYFAAESQPFDDYHGFSHHEEHPHAASHPHRDYISPYASESRPGSRAAFNDYGPPKGFFDTEFISFGHGGGHGGHSGNKGTAPKAAEASRSETKVQDGIQHDKKTKKCEKVQKDSMICEICKDDFGGFSEHCSHSLHSGKDQKYANSRRTSRDEVYDPLKHQGQHQPPKHEASARSASNDHLQKRNDEQKIASKDSPYSSSSFSSKSSPPSHSPSKHQLHHHSDDVYDPHASFINEYKPESRPDPQDPFKNVFLNQFDTYKPHKQTFKKETYKHPQLLNPKQTQPQTKGISSPQNNLTTLKTKTVQQQHPATDQVKSYQHSGNTPSVPNTPKTVETKSKLDQSVDKTFETQPTTTQKQPQPDLPSYTSKTANNESPSISKTVHSSSQSANAIKTPKYEEKGDMAIFAKKSVLKDHPNVYRESQPKIVYASHPNVYHTSTGDGRDKNFGKANLYDPFPSHTSYDPYNFEDVQEMDDSSSLGRVKTLNDYRRSVFASFSPTSDKLQRLTPEATKQGPQKVSSPTTNARYNHDNHNNHYKPLDPVQNFKVLGQMVKQFSKKDRTKCKKKTTKDGMTCYVCPNKHGQVDEECMYEKTDPKDGVHMMYKEETSY